MAMIHLTHALRTLLPLFLILGTVSLSGQNNPYTSAAQSDPEARRILESIRQKYDGYETITGDFKLEISLPGQPVEVQTGTLKRKGDFVRFRVGSQEGIINQVAAYYILHGSKEVQINDLPEPGETTGMLSPQNLFSFYEGEEYVLALQREEDLDGRKVKVIEMKPVDRNNSDFTKMRLLVDDRAREIVSVKAFSSDGSSFTFVLNNVRGDQRLDDAVFTFRQDEFSGYRVEDLRF